jgi:hypothetical protein
MYCWVWSWMKLNKQSLVSFSAKTWLELGPPLLERGQVWDSLNGRSDPLKTISDIQWMFSLSKTVCAITPSSALWTLLVDNPFTFAHSFVIFCWATCFGLYGHHQAHVHVFKLLHCSLCINIHRRISMLSKLKWVNVLFYLFYIYLCMYIYTKTTAQ